MQLLLLWGILLASPCLGEPAILTKLFDHPYWGQKELYYAYTSDTPTAATETAYYYRYDEAVNFDWGEDGPRILKDRFSAIFEGTLKNVPWLVVDCDDGFELTIQSEKKPISTLDNSWDRFPTFVQGASGKFTLKYFEQYGKAHCKFRKVSSTAGSDMASWAAKWEDEKDREEAFPVLTAADFGGAPGKPNCGNTACYALTTAEEIEAEEKQLGKEVRDWQPLAEISGKSSERIKRDYYRYGMKPSATYTEDWVKPCTDFDLMGRHLKDNKVRIEENVVIKITMGEFTDFYRPKTGHNLCDMLTSNSMHEWAPTEHGPWYKPKYNRWMLGSSDAYVPTTLTFKDWRRYPTSWGEIGEGAGCCYDKVKPDDWKEPTWKMNGGEKKLGFKIWTRYHFRGTPTPEIAKVTEDSTEYVVYAQIGGGKDTKKPDMFKSGWNLQYMTAGDDPTRKLHAQFIQKCEDYNPWGDKTHLKMKFGQYNHKNEWVGEYATYFRPSEGNTLCDMLLSSQNHEWSEDGINWYIPDYNKNLGGGSAWSWPKTHGIGTPKKWKMNHLPFWFGATGCYSKYDEKEGGEGNWGHSCQMLIASKERAGLPDKPLRLPAGAWVPYLLHLGTEAEGRSVKLPKRDWNAIKNDYLEPAGQQTVTPPKDPKDAKPTPHAEEVAAPKAGEKVTVNGEEKTWTKMVNRNLPTLWGTSSKEENDFVEYWAMVVKGTANADVWPWFRCDDKCQIYYDGELLFESGYDQGRDVKSKKAMKVNTSEWKQLLFKMHDAGWGSNFAVKFDKDVEWFWSK